MFEKIWKNKGGVEIPLSEAELSFGTPKGVITQGKNLIRRQQMRFRHFSDFWTFEFLDF